MIRGRRKIKRKEKVKERGEKKRKRLCNLKMN
jgi:hypothetical protein